MREALETLVLKRWLPQLIGEDVREDENVRTFTNSNAKQDEDIQIRIFPMRHDIQLCMCCLLRIVSWKLKEKCVWRSTSTEYIETASRRNTR